MPERIALIDVVGYGRAEVNGRLSECVVGEEVSSKAVEGCRLEGVLSSIFRFVCASPSDFVRLWQRSEYEAGICHS